MRIGVRRAGCAGAGGVCGAHRVCDGDGACAGWDGCGGGRGAVAGVGWDGWGLCVWLSMVGDILCRRDWTGGRCWGWGRYAMVV